MESAAEIKKLQPDAEVTCILRVARSSQTSVTVIKLFDQKINSKNKSATMVMDIKLFVCTMLSFTVGY